ncbi:MAG: cupin domain-containing protein [Candidatus Poribacteria bacterium]|nr:cupin domain-containing protein [Candidatus Poribacteria bacterium]
MPIFTEGSKQAPQWCELEQFDIVALKAGESHTFERIGKKEKLIVPNGSYRVTFGHSSIDADAYSNLDLTDAEGVFHVEAKSDITAIRMAGHWGDDVGGSGLFSVRNMDEPKDGGDAVAYPKTTSFDAHWHDCDEYWIILEGDGTVVTEGKQYDVKAGDCVATGMGFHHDFPRVGAPVKAIYFETTMEGQKRRGHLWNHTHGAPEPSMDRV